MKKFNIWREGYAATGDREYARLMHSEVAGETFKEACIEAFKGDKDFRTRSSTASFVSAVVTTASFWARFKNVNASAASHGQDTVCI